MKTMIAVIKNDIFSVPCDILVNPVNCVGVMGKGLALSFKEKFPDMYIAYKAACIAKEINIGKIWLFPDFKKQINIVCFPTKYHWKDKSDYSFIREGFISLRNYIDYNY